MIVAITISAIPVLITFILAMRYIEKTNRYKRSLEEIIYFLDGVEGVMSHDEMRISQARRAALRALGHI